MSARHLLNNAENGNFEAAVQVFLNYKDGSNGFDKNSDSANLYFKKALTILYSDFYLSELDIKNFKKIKELKISFNKNLTVFIGENGVGKTTLLEAIRKNLMWIAASTRKDNDNGGKISKEEINNVNHTYGACIYCEFKIGNSYKFDGQVARAPEGVSSNLKSELTKYRELGRIFRTLNEFQGVNLPLFAFYGIDRLQKGSTKSKGVSVGKIDGYDDSLNSKTSFDTFVEWLIQLLKIKKGTEVQTEKTKIQSKIDSLLAAGADDKNHPLTEIYEELVLALQLYPVQDLQTKPNNCIENLVSLFKEIYSDLNKIQLDNSDGKDKVAFQLEKDQLFLHQLSDGQRVLFGLIGDIARRLILLNNAAEQPFKGQGIVLIDEIELHLHPIWQQNIILILRKSFPNIQFIVTTHSSHILSTVDKGQIRIVKDNKIESVLFQTKGVASSDILEQIMGAYSVPQAINEAQWVEDYLILVQKNEHESIKANDLFNNLINHFGENHPVISSIRNQVKIASLRKRITNRD